MSAQLSLNDLKNNPIRTFMCDDCKSRLDTPKQRAQHYPSMTRRINKLEIENVKVTGNNSI